MTWPRKLPLEKRMELIQRVQEEIGSYKAGAIRQLTSNKELASIYDVNQYHVNYILYRWSDIIAKEDLHLRAKQLFSQSTKRRKPHQGHKKLGGKVRELIDCVTKEIADFKESKIEKLSTNTQYAESYHVCNQSISKYLNENLSEQDREYRIFILLRQAGQRAMSQLSSYQRAELSRVGYEAGVGKMTKKEIAENGRKGGIIAYSKGLALLTPEQRIKNARKASLSGLPKEQRIKNLLEKSQRTPNNLENTVINFCI